MIRLRRMPIALPRDDSIHSNTNLEKSQEFAGDFNKARLKCIQLCALIEKAENEL